MRRIRKRMLAVLLAASMVFGLVPNGFTITAFATNEADGTKKMRTVGVFQTAVGTSDDPSFTSAVINRARTDPAGPFYPTGLNYGEMKSSEGLDMLIFWQVYTGSEESGDGFNYKIFDRIRMNCVEKHTGDTARNVFNNGFSRGILRINQDGDLVYATTGELATPITAGNVKFSTNFLIACLGYQSDFSDITDSDGYLSVSDLERYYTSLNLFGCIY